ncbi:AraC family transcriptional regulator [Desulfovibrio sp. OttesenSCG-928-A18]|nr:AraC family transcriptional regulator [Desulfovibrio sp. OttesenSCG-928-A18]
MVHSSEKKQTIMAQRVSEHSDKIRDILRRPGVGLIVDVFQKSDLYVLSMDMDEPALVLVRRGKMTLQTARGEWTVHEGEAIAIAAGQTVNVTNHLAKDGIYEERWLTWDMELIKEFASKVQNYSPLPSAHIFKNDGSTFPNAFDSAYAAIEARELPQAVAVHRVTEILVWLALQGVYYGTTEKRTLSSCIRRILNTRLEESWSEEVVAKEVGHSPATLRRHLAAEGTTFREVLTEARMVYALRLLQSTDRPISQIALDVGYESQSRFAIRFRKRFGFQPSTIRGHKRPSLDSEAGSGFTPSA